MAEVFSLFVARIWVCRYFSRGKHYTCESESGMLERKRFSKIDFIFILVYEGGEKVEPRLSTSYRV
jgi:hypothetical protein